MSADGANISWIDENSHFRGDNNDRRAGEVDAIRLPKDAFFAHQVMWNGWVDPERPGIHINGHWNYAAGTTRTVYVEATTPLVELFLNGTSLGVHSPTAPLPFQVKEAHPLVELNGTVDQAAAEKTATLPPVLSVIETEVYQATNGR